ncbi:MAG: hypothetical protein ABEH81_01025 [Halopenitus sp.]
MPGAREYGDVSSYPLDSNVSLDAEGYLLNFTSNDDLQKVPAAGANVFGVNYKSTADQDGNLETGGQIGTVRHSAAFPVRAAAESYSPGDDVYVSGSTAGVVSAADTAQERVGVVVEKDPLDLTTTSDGDETVLVAFSFN